MLLVWFAAPGLTRAAESAGACPRPAPGSAVPEPRDLRSQNGVLRLDLTIRNVAGPGGSRRYCYLLPDGTQSPTLRLHPGELLILRLKNALTEDTPPTPTTPASSVHAAHMHAAAAAAGCVSGDVTVTIALTSWPPSGRYSF